MNVEATKAAVSISEMARMVGLSRARFYELKSKGVFPEPEDDSLTGRPIYTLDLQRQCLHVRRTNCGIDGTPVVFYARRRDLGSSKAPVPKRATKPKPSNQTTDLTDGLRALGLSSFSARDVDAALAELFPGGTADDDPAEVLRAVFIRLQSRNSTG